VPAREEGTAGAHSRAGGLRCYGCGTAHAELTATSCERCDGPLVVAAERDFERQPWCGRPADGLWRFADVLLPVDAGARVTLSEGDTPTLVADRLAGELGVRSLLLKDESRNPTGTFKDRCLAVAASVALHTGAPGIVCASTGNAGASTAAYAARAGLPAVIIVPERTPPSKLAQARAYGAEVLPVQGGYSDAYGLAKIAAERLGYVNATTTFVSPYSAEGSRSVAYELHETLGEPPDWISVPIGAGALLAGLFDAYSDLVEAGFADRAPRMLAVQPSGCAPIVRAWEEGADTVTAWDEPDTLVGSLADPLRGYEREGLLTLDAVRASAGAGVRVPDDDTLAAVRKLGGAGVFAEPGGAIGLAGVARAVEAGLIAADETVVCCVTGSGLKDPFVAVPDDMPAAIPADRESVIAWLVDAHGSRED
jgi:threonine synthase